VKDIVAATPDTSTTSSVTPPSVTPSSGSSSDSDTTSSGIYTALANTNGSTIRGSNLNIQA
jgi:hypothetical protein